MKAYQRRPQSCRRTTKQERMQTYYEHIQAKYSGQTSLEESSKPRCKSASPLPMSSGLVTGNMRGNNVELMQMMSLSTPRTPIQRIGNFSYPRKAWQSPELSSDHTGATAVHHNMSKQHSHPSKSVYGASEDHKYHNRFSGNSLPKWNQLYRAHHDSS